MATIDTHSDSLLQIIKDLRDDTTALFRQEAALAKRELAGKAATYARNAAFLGVSALVGVYAVFFLFLSLNNLLQTGLAVVGFSPGVASWFAPLIMGMLLGIGALLVALKALKAIRKEKPMPQMTLDSIREDKDWIQGKVKG